MNGRPLVMVAGLGRCGSSLMMQMLAAGGLRCLGDFPDFEDFETMPDGRRVGPDILERCEAAKFLMPHMVRIDPALPRVAIWTDRDETQQALSQIKFINGVSPDVLRGQPMDLVLKKYVLRLGAERRQSLRSLNGFEVLEMKFERTLRSPTKSANRIADFLRPYGFVLDERAMAAAVVPRQPEVALGFDMELTLGARAEAR